MKDEAKQELQQGVKDIDFYLHDIDVKDSHQVAFEVQQLMTKYVAKDKQEAFVKDLAQFIKNYLNDA